MTRTLAWVAVASTVLLVSCGGGGDGGGGGAATSAPVSTGYFIDSPVQGLGYNTTSGLSGHTGPNGEFQYRVGDVVNFTMGGTTIGSAAGQPHKLQRREPNRARADHQTGFASLQTAPLHGVAADGEGFHEC